MKSVTISETPSPFAQHSTLTLVDLQDLVAVVGIIHLLVVMPDHGGRCLKAVWMYLNCHISPLTKGGLQVLPTWEKHFLEVSHHILPFVAIYKLTLQIFQ